MTAMRYPLPSGGREGSQLGGAMDVEGDRLEIDILFVGDGPDYTLM